MLITLIFLVLFIISIVLFIADFDCSRGYGFILGSLSLPILIVCVFIIIYSNFVGVPNRIAQNQMEYESLIMRYEIINSNYEDYSKSDVIRDINEWNKHVISDRYWNDNILTSWFWCDKVVDKLEIIEFKEE